MGFMDAVKICLNKYVDFSGRARRAEFWWFFLFSLLVQVVGGILDGILGSQIGVVGLLIGLALFLPSLAVAVRRLHDKDMTGWWVLMIFFPLIGAIALLIICAIKGTEGENRFGPDPVT